MSRVNEDLQDRPDVALNPPSIFAAAFVIGVLLRAFLGGWLALPDLLAEVFGGLAIFAAFVLCVSAVFAFAEAGETLRPSSPSRELFVGGAYKYSRNPIYLGFVLLGIGFGVATGNLWVVLTSVGAGAVVNFFVIPQEEEYLARRFGAQYQQYRSTTRRWL